MGYVSENLMPGERVIKQASIHWFVFAPGVLLVLLAVLFGNAPAIIPVMLASLGVIFVIRAAITMLTTELAVTSKRVIAKTGLISRKTVELNLGKIETLNVSQGVFGRLLDFGTVVVTGTGGGKTPIPCIVQPLGFRQTVMQAVEAAPA